MKSGILPERELEGQSSTWDFGRDGFGRDRSGRNLWILGVLSQ